MSILRSRLVRRLRPGIAEMLDQAPRRQAEWEAANQAALRADGPLYVALGDSTALGLGAPAYDLGYVGQLRAMLEARDGRPWRVVNVAKSGARVKNVLRQQLPSFDALPSPPDLVTCSVGANDVLRFWLPLPLVQFQALIAALPDQAIIATLPKGLRHGPTARVNALVRREAPRYGLRVADVWSHTGPPWEGKLAADDFHPNDVGYRDWTAAFCEVLGLPAA